MINKLFMILIVTLPSFALGDAVRRGSNRVVIKPFGFIDHKQPPPSSKTIVIAEPSISFEAQQVCGYTDWSTAAITLPTELLTADYWSDVGETIKRESINQLLAVAGALPSMLACNASPTYCHILNQAKAMAQGELSFTMDGCEMLDGLANVDGLQSEPLRNCIQKKMAENGRLSASKAREWCITGGNLTKKSKQDKLDHAGSKGGDGYDSQMLTDEACAEEQNDRYIYSYHPYTVSKTSCSWLKELFPGFAIQAKGSIKTGGTFQPIAEKKYTDRVEKTNKYLVQLLEIMHEHRYGKGSRSSYGPLPRHKVLSSSTVRTKMGLKSDGKLRGLCAEGSGSSCKADPSLIPPIYRLSSDGKEPSLLIDPAMIYELVEVVGPDSSPTVEYQKQPSRLALLLSRITQASSYVQTNDVVGEALGKVIATCTANPKLKGAAAQVDCKSKISLLQAEQESLAKRRETDRDFLVAQMQFYNEVARAKSDVSKLNMGRETGRGVDTPKDPSQIR